MSGEQRADFEHLSKEKHDASNWGRCWCGMPLVGDLCMAVLSEAEQLRSGVRVTHYGEADYLEQRRTGA